MFSRTIVYATALALTSFQLVAAVGCPNGGAALGYYTDCFTIGISPVCQTYTFIATGGTCDRDAVRSGSDGCGGGYTNGAYVTCNNDVTVSINPPGMGTHKCSQKKIVCDSDPSSYQKIEYCCYPV